MLGLDERLAGAGAGGGVVIALLVALLLGLRHATDPDHLTAVSTLVLGDREHGTRRSTALGLAWGAGHAVTLLALGVPFVLWGDALPDRVQQAAEVTIGLLIVGLAVRLLIRWRRGSFHLHPHRHGEVVHAHPHMHEGGHRHEHRHAHPDALGRTPLAAFGIGLVHGVGGSAGAGILLVSSIGDRTMAALALVLFAMATALAMGLATLAFTHILAHRRVAVRLESAMPVIGGSGSRSGPGTRSAASKPCRTCSERSTRLRHTVRVGRTASPATRGSADDRAQVGPEAERCLRDGRGGAGRPAHDARWPRQADR